jgi:hypothetical protein
MRSTYAALNGTLSTLSVIIASTSGGAMVGSWVSRLGWKLMNGKKPPPFLRRKRSKNPFTQIEKLRPPLQSGYQSDGPRGCTLGLLQRTAVYRYIYRYHPFHARIPVSCVSDGLKVQPRFPQSAPNTTCRKLTPSTSQGHPRARLPANRTSFAMEGDSQGLTEPPFVARVSASFKRYVKVLRC